MSDKIVMISELTFDEANKKAYDKTSDMLAEMVARDKISLLDGMLMTAVLAEHTNNIKDELFGKKED